MQTWRSPSREGSSLRHWQSHIGLVDSDWLATGSERTYTAENPPYYRPLGRRMTNVVPDYMLFSSAPSVARRPQFYVETPPYPQQSYSHLACGHTQRHPILLLFSWENEFVHVGELCSNVADPYEVPVLCTIAGKSACP